MQKQRWSVIDIGLFRPRRKVAGFLFGQLTAQLRQRKRGKAMAARKNLPHSERTRSKIRTSMLINRLESLVEGKVEMTGPQVTAALGLIKKTLPDLASVDLNATVESKVVGEVVFRGLNG
jgi:hypothetical protein